MFRTQHTLDKKFQPKKRTILLVIYVLFIFIFSLSMIAYTIADNFEKNIFKSHMNSFVGYVSNNYVTKILDK